MIRLSPAWSQLRHHPVQHRLWRSKARFKLVVAGRGSGKTELAKRQLVAQLPQPKPWRDPRYFYGGPTVQQAKRIAWNDLVNLCPRNWIASINRSELYIETIFGSQLWCVGLDAPQRVEGVQWDGCVIDESCDQKPGVFDLNILPALTHRSGWAWRIGVPKRTGPSAPEFREAFENAMACTDGVSEAFTWESGDIVPQDLLTYARQHMTEQDFNEQFCALWQTVGGGIYYAFSEANVRPCEYHKDKPIVVASDFNITPMCWAIGHRWENRMEWFDEIVLRDSNTAETLNELWTRYASHKMGFEFYGDATSKARAGGNATQSDYELIESDARFRKAGRAVYYKDSNPAQQDRWAAVNAMLCNADGDRRMFFSKRCKFTVKDFQRTGYKPGTRDADKRGDIGHMTDAVGYAVYQLFPIEVPLDFDDVGDIGMISAR